VTAYPCPAKWVDLRLAAAWGGLSDHSGTPYPGLAAAALGCKVLEVHVCWSKEQGGFDTAASLDMGQLRQLVEGVRFIEQAMRPTDKDELAAQLADVRGVFM
jgi:N,N'-diacetyllegionaminate synthase